MKRADQILDKWYKPKRHSKTINRNLIIEAMEEYAYQHEIADLIRWLNNECPHGTNDLSHDFVENLRNRLDQLTIK